MISMSFIRIVISSLKSEIALKHIEMHISSIYFSKFFRGAYVVLHTNFKLRNSIVDRRQGDDV